MEIKAILFYSVLLKTQESVHTCATSLGINTFLCRSCNFCGTSLHSSALVKRCRNPRQQSEGEHGGGGEGRRKGGGVGGWGRVKMEIPSPQIPFREALHIFKVSIVFVS